LEQKRRSKSIEYCPSPKCASKTLLGESACASVAEQQQQTKTRIADDMKGELDTKVGYSFGKFEVS